MNTENNNDNKSTDKLKQADEFSDAAFNAKTNEEKPAKKIKRKATNKQLNHPLHGVKLAYILESLVEYYGWKYLEREVNILCFKHNPTIKVSLKFLRKMDWAREHVEDIYMGMLKEETYQKGLVK